MESKQTAVERIYEQLEAGNLEIVLQAKDMFLSLEKIDLKLQYEKGALNEIHKLALKIN
jgi:hypothetical protein